MIYAGTDLKFRITTMVPGFKIERDDFSLSIINSLYKELCNIKKDDCFQDSEGSFYFLMENVPTGEYHAIFTAKVPDDDYSKQVRLVRDRQFLCKVGTCDSRGNNCQCGETFVEYRQVWSVNLDDGLYLADKDGNLILTSDGERIQFNSRR